MDGVKYWTIEGVPGEYFRCDRMAASLSVKACQGFYRKAMTPSGLANGNRAQCAGCPVGASHSGILPEQASSSRFLGKLICSRCRESARRLIRKSVCVSCYNREREVALGRNAKGNAPIHCPQVSTVTIACVLGGSAGMAVRQHDRVLDRVEAVISTVRHEQRSVSFGWLAPPIVRESQLVGELL